MPRNCKISPKSKKGKEIQCEYAKKKENNNFKELKNKSYVNQEANSFYGYSDHQQQIQSYPMLSHECPQIYPGQQLIQLNKSQSRSTSNLLSRNNPSQTFSSNFIQNSFHLANNYNMFTPNSFYPSNTQALISNHTQCSMSSKMNVPLNQSLDSSSNFSPLTQKQKRQKFTTEEDGIIIKLVGDNKFPNWNEIATHIKGRTGRQCRERYQHYLSPNLSCDPWTLQEDKMVFDLHKLYGTKWALIAQHFNGKRTNNSIKNRWNNHIRFFKDSFLNCIKCPENKVNTLNNSNNDSFVDSNNKITSSINTLNNQDFSNGSLISNINDKCMSDSQGFNSNSFIQKPEQVSQQQSLVLLTSTPHTPEPHIPTFSFNLDNWNPFDQKGSINNSSSGNLPILDIKDIANITGKLSDSEPQKSNAIINGGSIFKSEQDQLNLTPSAYGEQNVKKETQLEQNRPDDDKSKNFVDQILSCANYENSADQYYIDFDFLIF